MSNLSNSSGSLKSQPSSKGHPLGLSTSTSNLLLEKVNGRRSTPDSDAMASSEDDENHHLETAMPAAAAHKPVRRASWLNDPSQPMPLGQPRKNSFASSTMSPTASHPTTPSTETSLWGTHGPAAPGIAAGRGASAAFSWGQGIWNTNSKEPPPRLTEVFASSPPASNSSFANAELFGSETTPTAESSLPFQIPLHPTPKTYRSQSYSVGQMEADLANTNSAIAPGFGRGRGPNQPGLQHRPSRPSMLSEISDSTGLGKLKEVEDDEADSLESSTQSLLQMRDPSKVVEDLLRENAMLKQQQQQQNLRSLRPRSATSNTLGHGAAGPFGLEGGLTEDPLDYAIDENEEIGDLHDISNRGLPGRRMSEYEFRSGSGRGAFAGLENRKLENLKKAHWQSSLGFGANEFTTPSRRHSFADVPTRHGSIGSIGSPSAGLSDLPTAQEVQRFSQADSSEYLINDHAASYFGGPSVQPRNADQYSMTSPTYNPYAMPSSYGLPQTPSYRTIYNVSQPRHNQLLYIVLFKCSRADVFYVQEGTGLSVKPGDLVIVEADRGTDLGTVAHDNVDWATAKELKEQYAEEHYKWLMMYSQGAVGTGDGTGAGLMASSNRLQGSAVGGMGPPTQHGMQEPSTGELKPKIIKRLAQTHEIQALRDKEGNEAKAKRVCMQKVKEHGLHMEILDAEFQMDWKKLTFYYFADAYINFNSLVTDLFKVYKTRIWMSAINPASFASPSLGLQAPSGVGPGAVGVGAVNRGSDRARGQQQEVFTPTRGGNGGYGQERGAVSPMSYQQTPQSGMSYGYGAFNSPSSFASSPPMSSASFGRNSGGYGGGMPQIDPFVAFAPEYGMGMMGGSYMHPGQEQEGEYRQGGSPGQPAWIGSFQSLSLGSR